MAIERPARSAYCRPAVSSISKTAIVGCHIAACDPAGHEHSSGHLVFDHDRILTLGDGPPPAEHADAARVPAGGCLLTPGLINTHHHLYQWITRGLAQDATLFGWLTALYPVWAGLDAEAMFAAAAANLGWMALTGTTTVSDHHYVFPVAGGDVLAAEIEAARLIGVRLHAARGSMDRGQSQGGLPPDSVVEDRDEILTATTAAIDRYHDPSPESRLRIVVAPCSPFSVTEGLMRDAAELARERGVRLHTHLAETTDEDEYCREHFGCTPAQYAEELGWLGEDVWMAHCVHLAEEAVGRFGATGTGVAHCPTSNGRLGAGSAPVRALLAAGAPVGLGVDGAASNESGRMVDELHQALLVARTREGPLALAVRQALLLATAGGARCLGRERELGSLEPGKLADLALWRVDGLPGAGIEDPVATLVLGAPRLERLWVGGRELVSDGHLASADESALAAAAGGAACRLRERADVR